MTCKTCNKHYSRDGDFVEIIQYQFVMTYGMCMDCKIGQTYKEVDSE